MKVSFKSGQCGGGILETDELYSEPSEPSSVSFQVELIYRDLYKNENHKIWSEFQNHFYLESEQKRFWIHGGIVSIKNIFSQMFFL